ncbi:MAG: hypothetical protein WA876_10935 [Candidatus Acidiferrales bacterium]
MTPSNEDVLSELSNKLNILIAVALSPDIRDKSGSEKIEFLTRFGISNQNVADVLGTTKGTVEVLKSRASKRKKRTK